MNTSRKGIMLSAAVIIVFVAYAVSQQYGNQGSVVANQAASGASSGSQAVVVPSSGPQVADQSQAGSQVSGSASSAAVAQSSQPSQSAPSSAPSSAPAASTGLYKDGVYDGVVADAYFGNMQVQATVSGGKLSNVTFLSYPNDNRESETINTRALVALRSEAIASQSANVDIVSGATQSSQAFQQSLQSALDKAKV